MEPNFRSYLCNVNGSLASILLDLGLRGQAPIKTKPWLLWVWVYMRTPRPDGLSSGDEAPKLYEIEDAIELHLGREFGATFCGRITTESRRELYFYGETPEGLEQAVNRAMASFAGYKFDLGVKADPEWTQYLDVLFPGPVDMQRIQNGILLDVLTGEGDILSNPRRVRHWIYFPSAESRLLFAKAAVDAGFIIDSEGEVDGDRRFSVCVYRVQSIEQKGIDETTILLLHLAQGLHGDYDGWETQVITQ
jgi:Family of unknown function (DUF695)/Regulator of ribonuclease activity B